MENENEKLNGTEIDAVKNPAETAADTSAAPVEPDVNDTPAELTESKDTVSPEKGSKSLFGIVIALGIVIVALIVLLIVLLVNRNNKDKEPAKTDVENNQTVTVEADPIGNNVEDEVEVTPALPTQAIAPKEFNVSGNLGNYK